MSKRKRCFFGFLCFALVVGGLWYSYVTLFGLRRSGVGKPVIDKNLVDIATRHGLPMPPKEARLVLAHTGGFGNNPGIYSPAFLLEEKADGGVVFLRGGEQLTLEKKDSKRPWREFFVEPVVPVLGGYVSTFHDLSTFICAVQLATRGEDDYAQAVWQRFASEWSGDPDEDIPAKLEDLSLLLGHCIFVHLKNRLGDPDNWPDVHARMTALFDEFPELKEDRRNELYTDVGLTINAQLPAADSVEALLLDWARKPSESRHLGIFYSENDQSNAAARAVVFLGFDAVPELLALNEDRRISVHRLPAIGNCRSRLLRVGDLADKLLREIAGDTRPQVWRDAAAWRAWWEITRQQKEEDFLAKAVFTREDGGITSVHETPVRRLARDYPEKLPWLFEEFSQHATAKAHPGALASALTTSRLPKKTQVQVLAKCARGGSFFHQCTFLRYLAALDQPQCVEILLSVFEKLPNDVVDDYCWCSEARFAQVVLELEDDGVWREYLRVAKRSSVGLRMEMLNHWTTRDKNRSRQLAFLAAFLDDDTIRDMQGNSRFGGPCAAFTIPRIEVRDFAAMGIAFVLGLDDRPDEFWTADQWRQFREKVRKRLKAEKLPNLKSPS